MDLKSSLLPLTVAALLATAPVAVSAPAATSAPAIGIISASGHFHVDGSEVWGNTTLFDGGKLETANASSEATLRNGVKIQLGAATSANISDRQLTLFHGTGQISGSNSYGVAAGGLAVRPATSGRVRVDLASPGSVDVVSLSGDALVTSAQTGMLLASIPAGQRMTFAMQAQAAAGPATRTGCLLYKDNRFLIQDQISQEILELTGATLAQNVGNRVTAAGNILTNARPGVTGATGVMAVANISNVQPGGCLSVAAALNAQTNVTGTPVQQPVQQPTTAAAKPAPVKPAPVKATPVKPAPTTTASATPATPAPAAAPAPAATSTPASTSAPAATTAKGGMSTGAKIAIVAVIGGGGAGAALALSGGKKSTSP